MSYVEGNWIFEGSGFFGGIGEVFVWKYFWDVVVGFLYFYSYVRDFYFMFFNSLFCVVGVVYKFNLRISEGFYSFFWD